MDDLSDREYQDAMHQLTRIDELTAQGILGAEEFPEPTYLHWRVLKPEELPQEFKTSYEHFDEVRWYR